MLLTLLGAGAWAWLNIPGVEGPGARFSYDTEIQRTGPRFQARIRFDAAIPGRNGRAVVESLVEIDCEAGTRRTLHETRGRSSFATPRAAPAPVLPQSRESVLVFLLCPGQAPLRR